MRVLGAVVVLAILAVTPVEAGPQVAAHRGGALLWPENSLGAFKGALGLGVDLLETDVHLTADGEVVILHDPTLERTTTGQGPVEQVSLAALREIRLKTPAGDVLAEGVPTLAELLDVVKPTRAHLLLEIKGNRHRERYAGIEEKVLALLRARGLAERTIVMGFDPATIRRVRELDPKIRTALLVSRGRVQRELVPATESVRWAVEADASHLGIDHRALDADVVAAARRAGLGVAAWTVNDEDGLKRVIGLGVDVVITDQPDLALRLVGR